MPDFLDVLARDAKATVESGYYEHPAKASTPRVSLHKAIVNSLLVPVIAEIKRASPSGGMIRRNFEVEQIALSMERSGAVGISVLTEPKHFMGSLSSLTKVHTAVRLPILMKDIVLSIEQLDAATALGANAVLLIQGIYDRGYGEREIVEMIKEAHSRGLEVLLEVHDENEFHRAVTSDADLIGINNRNLATLQVDLNTTKKILERAPMSGMLVVSESGIKTADDIRFLNGCGANAFLVGSAVMSADDVESKVRDLANATKSKEIKA